MPPSEVALRATWPTSPDVRHILCAVNWLLDWRSIHVQENATYADLRRECTWQCLFWYASRAVAKTIHLRNRCAARLLFKALRHRPRERLLSHQSKPHRTYPRRPASGDFDKTGTFTLTTFTKDDGIIPGKYRVNINCWREPPTLKTKLSANYVPADFKFEVTIDENADEPVELRIDVPKIQRGQ